MNTQPRLFADAWPWEPEPPEPTRPLCYRCGRPALADSHDRGAVWCSGCGSVEPRLSPKREAELRAEVRAPHPGRRRRPPFSGGTRL